MEKLIVKCSAISLLRIDILNEDNIIGEFSTFKSDTKLDAVKLASFLLKNSSELFYKTLLEELNERK